MKGAVRIVVVGLAVLLVVTAGMAAVFYQGKTQEAARRARVEEDLRGALKAKARAEQERQALQEAQRALEEQVAALGRERDALQEKVLQDEQLYLQLEEELAQQRAQLTEVQGYLDTERSEKQALATRVQQLEQEKSDIETRLSQLTHERQELERQVQALGGGGQVPLERIVVQPTPGAAGAAAPSPPSASAPASAPSGIQGQVLVVNRDFDFIVTSLGERDPIQVGTLLGVYENGRMVGRVQVERIYGTMSAATILPETKKDVLKEGQVVKTL